jgi:Icc-related predicted phosphoesterase
MNIAVFADLHGRILLAFKLCARWQQETGETIDLILQAGDLGAYPATSQLDRATIKHAQKDPTELGFSNDFTIYRDDVAAILSQTKCPMWFVRGNHEDHTWLDTIEQQHEDSIFPVDVYQRIFCMKSGLPTTFNANGSTITVMGIGRIAPLPGEQKVAQSKYIQPYELERIYNLDNPHIDILLTHDTALDFLTVNFGMEEIRLVLDSFTPAYHFHGHTEQPYYQKMDTKGKTIVIKLSDLHWNDKTSHSSLEAGGMGILRWLNSQKHQFEVVEADWFNHYTAQSWRNE